MCSGCSGDYSDGFDFDDSEDLEADSVGTAGLAWLCGERDTDLEFHFKEGLRGFEASTGAGLNLESKAESSADAGEKCEILVSGTQIIEIRMIPANSHYVSELRRVQASEMAAARKQSDAASAKYYQTCKGSAKTTTNRVQVSGALRVAGCAAGECKHQFAKSFEWARRTFGKLRAGNFRWS
jgi:hypothetical protein